MIWASVPLNHVTQPIFEKNAKYFFNLFCAVV